MTDDSLRDAFSARGTDSPTDEHRFLQELEGRLSAGWNGATADGSTGTTADAATTASTWSEHDGVEYLDPAPETIGEVVAETPARSKRSRWIAVGAVVATAALISGVAYVRNRDEQPTTIANIAAATSDAKTARMSYEVAMSAENASATMRGEGTIDFAAKGGTMDLTYDLSGSVFEITGSKLSSSQQKMRVIFRGKDAWLKGGFASFFSNTDDPKRDKWLHTTQTGDDSSDGGVTTMFLGGQSTLDPVGMLESLQKHGTLTAVSTETLHGDRTTKYRLTASRHDLNPKVRSTAPVSIYVWADDSLRLRKLHAGTAVTGQMGATTFEFWDFGVKVDTTPPAKADVIEEATQSLETFGERTKLTGDWEKFWAGSDGGVTWELWKAPTKNSTCWSLHTDPPLSSQESVVEPNPGPKHGGDPSTCTGTAGSGLNAASIASGSVGTTQVIALAGLDSTATATYPDGHQETYPTTGGALVLVLLDSGPPFVRLTSGQGPTATVCRQQDLGMSGLQFPGNDTTAYTVPASADSAISITCTPAYIDDMTQGPGAISGAWAEMRSGTDDGVSWSIVRAPARSGWECWAFTSSPPIGQESLTTDPWTFRGDPPTYKGNSAACRQVPGRGTTAFTISTEVMQLVQTEGSVIPSAFAVLFPQKRFHTATVTFADESHSSDTIAANLETFVAIGTKKIRSVLLEGVNGDYICERREYDNDGNEQPAPASSTEPITCQADGI